MTKLIALIMCGNQEKMIDLCIKSVIDQVDKVIICYDSTSFDRTREIIENNWKIDIYDQDGNDKVTVIERPYEHNLTVKNANSNQRNFYLNYLKRNHSGDYVLCLDGDEVCDENVIQLKTLIKAIESQPDISEAAVASSPKMVHFIGDLSHKDATQENHYVPNRFFKVTDDLYYNDGEHPVLQAKRQKRFCPRIDFFTIYHFAYAREMFYLLERIKTHRAKSEVHSNKFLDWWYNSHLAGEYPKRKIDITKLPKVIKEHFLLDDDYFYFQERAKLETKHFIDACFMRDHFKPKKVLLCGDGMGMRTMAFRYIGVDAKGFDISEYAVKNNIGQMPEDIYWVDDVRTFTALGYDLTVCYDVLEHLTEEELPQALENIYNSGEQFLFSIPFLGDPNLMNDETHKIFKEKSWWLEQLANAGFKVYETPGHFLYRQQLITAKK